MTEQHLAFLDFAANRDENAVEAGLNALNCPVLTLNAAWSVEENAEITLEWYQR